MDIKFETERLVIRKLSFDDREALFRYRSDSETNRYQSWVPEKLTDAEEFIRKTAPEPDMFNTWFQMVLTLKESGEIIGDAGIHFFDKYREQVELGCTVAREFHSQGYATEALTEIIRYLFEDLKKERLVCSVDPHNIASLNLFRKLGFREIVLSDNSLMNKRLEENFYICPEYPDDIILSMKNRRTGSIPSRQ